MNELIVATFIYVIYTIVMLGLAFYFGFNLKYRFIIAYIFSSILVPCIVLIFSCSVKLAMLISIFISIALIARIPSR